MKKKQKIRNTRAWKTTRRKARPERDTAKVEKLTKSLLNPKWNGEPCEAWTGTVIVGKSERPTWWCAGLEGTRRRCVKVQSWGEPFFIDNEDGRGAVKVFLRGGGPDTGHASIPVDDVDSFIPDVA